MCKQNSEAAEVHFNQHTRNEKRSRAMARTPMLTRDRVPEQFRAAFDAETATSGDVIAMGLGSVRNRRDMRHVGLKTSTPALESVKLATTGSPGQEVLAIRCNRSPTSLWSSTTASMRASAQRSRCCCGRMTSTPWSCGARDE